MLSISGNWTQAFRTVEFDLPKSSWTAELVAIDSNEAWYLGHGLDLNGIYFGYRIVIPWSWIPSISQTAVFMIAFIFLFWLLQQSHRSRLDHNNAEYLGAGAETQAQMNVEHYADLATFAQAHADSQAFCNSSHTEDDAKPPIWTATLTQATNHGLAGSCDESYVQYMSVRKDEGDIGRFRHTSWNMEVLYLYCLA